MELLITVEFEANVCLNNVLWTTTKMKPSFRTNRCANIGGLYLESRTSRRSVKVIATVATMPMKLSNYYRERTIALWKEGTNVSAIVRALHEEGRNTTRGTVRRWIFRLEQDRGLQDNFREGRPLKLTSEISEYLVRRLEEYDERTSFELQRLVARNLALTLVQPPYVDTFVFRCSGLWSGPDMGP